MRDDFPDETKLLKIAIEEQRRVYDWLYSNYQQAKNRIVSYFGAGLAVLTFLYASGDIFIPPTAYGKIFYFAGLGMVIVSLIALFVALKPKHWECPTELERLKEWESKTETEYLQYVKSRYIMCYEHNLKICEIKYKLLDLAVYPLVIGAIILVVLKVFKG